MSGERRTINVGTASAGALVGLMTALVGYLVTYLWTATRVSETLEGINVLAQLIGADAIPTWKAVGWLFFNAHFVATSLPTPGGSTMTRYLDDVGASAELLLVIVPALLILAGLAVAHRAAPQDTGRAAGLGASIAIGYTPATVAMLFLVEHTIAGGGTIGPDAVTGVLLAALVYPLLCGGIGGFLATRL